jgi:hypothetical protein
VLAVAEELMILRRGEVPHHGPVGPDCPVDCLRPVLSLMALHPLARAYDAPFEPPRTVGDVIGLYTGDRLREIRGLGARRISEIEAALVLAGLDITTANPATSRGAGEQGLRAVPSASAAGQVQRGAVPGLDVGGGEL